MEILVRFLRTLEEQINRDIGRRETLILVVFLSLALGVVIWAGISLISAYS